ncbi:MAG: hypothetical protein ABI557_11665, partial [Aureliella sp.]
YYYRTFYYDTKSYIGRCGTSLKGTFLPHLRSTRKRSPVPIKWDKLSNLQLPWQPPLSNAPPTPLDLHALPAIC